MTRPPLPPLSALRAFEAAARLGSFRDAAAELGVTPSAVSHQVKALEDWLGAAVFARSVRAVRLTELGAALARETGGAFDALAESAAQAKAAGADTRLRVSALPLFTNVWLVPRLARFAQAHPHVALEIETTNRVVDLHRDDVDVAIRNVFAPTTGLAARKLLDLHAVPLCAPALAATLKTPADLARATLIHISARRAGWDEWLAAAGVGDLKPAGNLSFDTIPSALEAATQGRGVLLGLAPLIWDAPGVAGLAPLFDLPPLSAGTYFIVHRRDDRARVVVRAFVDWVSAEMRADARRLSRLAPQRAAQD